MRAASRWSIAPASTMQLPGVGLMSSRPVCRGFEPRPPHRVSPVQRGSGSSTGQFRAAGHDVVAASGAARTK
jgi:hypothetical protein